MYWVLEDVDSIPYNILENESNINPISFFKKLIIDMKHEYNTKTKEELISALVKELVDNETNIQASQSLSNKLKSLKITSISDAFESSNDYEEEVLWEKMKKARTKNTQRTRKSIFISNQVKSRKVFWIDIIMNKWWKSRKVISWYYWKIVIWIYPRFLIN